MKRTEGRNEMEPQRENLERIPANVLVTISMKPGLRERIFAAMEAEEVTNLSDWTRRVLVAHLRKLERRKQA